MNDGHEPQLPDSKLYRWQHDALVSWLRCGRRGVIEAVTGSGKTEVAIAAASDAAAIATSVLPEPVTASMTPRRPQRSQETSASSCHRYSLRSGELRLVTIVQCLTVQTWERLVMRRLLATRIGRPATRLGCDGRPRGRAPDMSHLRIVGRGQSTQ